MKIRPEHYQHILTEMRQAIATIGKDAINAHIVAISGKPHDFDKRLRWDLCYAAKLNPWICKEIYPYASDEHLDTALRSVIRELDLPAFLTTGHF